MTDHDQNHERHIQEMKATRGGKSNVMEAAIAALARAGRKVMIVRADGQQTEILPFKRPAR